MQPTAGERKVQQAMDLGFKLHRIPADEGRWCCPECLGEIRLVNVPGHFTWHRILQEKLDNPINIINHSLSTEKIR